MSDDELRQFAVDNVVAWLQSSRQRIVDLQAENANLQAENAKLQSELAHTNRVLDAQVEILNKRDGQLLAALLEADRLRAALEQYADVNSWRAQNMYCRLKDVFWRTAKHGSSGWELAAKALKGE